jgi:phage shock protein PspC (stress-responsive transcriptional regulator)
MPLPARRTRRAAVHATTSTIAIAGLVAGIAAVFGIAGWVANLVVLGIIAVVVTLVAAYVLSRP